MTHLPGQDADGRFARHRFGLFIHWGLYAIGACHEQAQMRAAIPRADYEALIRQFNPQAYDPEAWVRMAKDCGMSYLCFVTKHHDGFCMWDTKQTDYNVLHTPYGRDTLALLARACREHGLALSLYYSIPDWHHPNAYNPLSTHQVPPRPSDVPDMDRYKDFVRRQVEELLTGYGPIHTFFWDIPPRLFDPSLNALVRSLQPNILINNRGFDEGDFATPERHVPEGGRFEGLTEACQSVGRESWGYRSNEDYFSPRFLRASVDTILAMGGNYLLNVGPMADGRISERAEAIVRSVGNWYLRVREAFEGAQPCPGLLQKPRVWLTRRDDALYLHFPNGPEAEGFALHPLQALPRAATLLNDGSSLDVTLSFMPTLYQSGPRFAHLAGLPTETLLDEPVVVRLDLDADAWASLEAARDAAGAKEIL